MVFATDLTFHLLEPIYLKIGGLCDDQQKEIFGMMGTGMMDSGNMMMDWGGMFFGPMTMVGFFALIVFVVVVLVKWISGGSTNHQSIGRAINILNERFAAGDIDEAEYANRKRQLQV